MIIIVSCKLKIAPTTTFFDYCNQIAGKGNFHLTRLDIAIDDRNDIPYFTVEQIKRKCLKDEFVSKSKSYRFSESSFDDDVAKTYILAMGNQIYLISSMTLIRNKAVNIITIPFHFKAIGSAKC